MRRMNRFGKQMVSEKRMTNGKGQGRVRMDIKATNSTAQWILTKHSDWMPSKGQKIGFFLRKEKECLKTFKIMALLWAHLNSFFLLSLCGHFDGKCLFILIARKKSSDWADREICCVVPSSQKWLPCFLTETNGIIWMLRMEKPLWQRVFLLMAVFSPDKPQYVPERKICVSSAPVCLGIRDRGSVRQLELGSVSYTGDQVRLDTQLILKVGSPVWLIPHVLLSREHVV